MHVRVFVACAVRRGPWRLAPACIRVRNVSRGCDTSCAVTYHTHIRTHVHTRTQAHAHTHIHTQHGPCVGVGVCGRRTFRGGQRYRDVKWSSGALCVFAVPQPRCPPLRRGDRVLSGRHSEETISGRVFPPGGYSTDDLGVSVRAASPSPAGPPSRLCVCARVRLRDRVCVRVCAVRVHTRPPHGRGNAARGHREG